MSSPSGEAELPTRVIPGIRPYFEFDDTTLLTIAGLLASGHVSNHGPQVHLFEQQLAEYLGISRTLAVSTGSDGLLLGLRALRLPKGKVILPAYTYIATLNAVVHSNLEPIFCDIEPDSFTLDTNHLTELLARHRDVQCIIPVNVFGVPPDLGKIRKLCDQSNAKLLYDNAHGFGTEVNGQRFQDGPDVQVFSFHATKTLPAIEGGMIVASDPEIFSLSTRLRNHGLAPNSADTIPGFNAKLDEIRATVGLRSLQSFSGTLSRRREYGIRLYQCFRRFPDIFRVQHIPKNVHTNFQNLGVICFPAEKVGLSHVLELFKKHGIGVRSYFDPPLYKLSGFDQEPALTVTESIWRTLISFPIHSRMTEETLSKMENAISSVVEILRNTR